MPRRGTILSVSTLSVRALAYVRSAILIPRASSSAMSGGLRCSVTSVRQSAALGVSGAFSTAATLLQRTCRPVGASPSRARIAHPLLASNKLWTAVQIGVLNFPLITSTCRNKLLACWTTGVLNAALIVKLTFDGSRIELVQQPCRFLFDIVTYCHYGLWVPNKL